MSLLWRRAGHSRVDSRVCCMIPSRNQTAVWRYVHNHIPSHQTANSSFLLLSHWCAAAFSESCVMNITAVFVLDAERVDVAAWKPKFLQWSLLNCVSVFAYMLYSTASVWMGCQATQGCASSCSVDITIYELVIAAGRYLFYGIREWRLTNILTSSVWLG